MTQQKTKKKKHKKTHKKKIKTDYMYARFYGINAGSDVQIYASNSSFIGNNKPNWVVCDLNVVACTSVKLYAYLGWSQVC